MADAQDLKFHFGRFLGVSSRSIKHQFQPCVYWSKMGFMASILAGRFQPQKWHKKWHNWHNQILSLAIMAAQFSGLGPVVVTTGGVCGVAGTGL